MFVRKTQTHFEQFLESLEGLQRQLKHTRVKQLFKLPAETFTHNNSVWIWSYFSGGDQHQGQWTMGPVHFGLKGLKTLDQRDRVGQGLTYSRDKTFSLFTLQLFNTWSGPGLT